MLVSIKSTKKIDEMFERVAKLQETGKFDFNPFLIFISTNFFSVSMLNLHENFFNIHSRGLFSEMTLQFLYD